MDHPASARGGAGGGVSGLDDVAESQGSGGCVEEQCVGGAVLWD